MRQILNNKHPNWSTGVPPAFILLLLILPAMMASCAGRDKTIRIAALQKDAIALAEQAVAYQQENRPGDAQTRYREAVDAYMQILDLAPNSYEALLNLGILHNYFKEYDKAAEVLDKAIKLNGHNGRAYFYRAFVYMKKGDTHEAEIAFKMSIDRDTSYAPAYFFHGKVEYDLGNHYSAKTSLEKYIALDPQGAYTALAKDYLGQIPADIAPPADMQILPEPPVVTETTPSQPETAPPPEQTQPEPTPVQPPATNTEPPAAEPPAQPPQAVAGPEPVTYRDFIEAGQYAMALKNYPSAIDYFKKAYAMEPLFLEVNYLLGRAYHSSGDLSKAIDHLKIALNQDPKDLASLLEIAYCYEAQGNKATAIEYFEKYLALKDRTDIREHVKELKGA